MARASRSAGVSEAARTHKVAISSEGTVAPECCGIVNGHSSVTYPFSLAQGVIFGHFFPMGNCSDYRLACFPWMNPGCPRILSGQASSLVVKKQGEMGMMLAPLCTE